MSLFSFHRQGLDFETSFEERPQHRSPPIWHHLKTILFPYRFQIFLSVLVLLWASLSLLGLGMGVRFIVDRVLQQQDGSSFIMDVLVVLTFLVSMLVSANYVRLSLVAWLTEQVIASLRIRVFRHLISLDIASFETLNVSSILGCLTTDMFVLQLLIGNVLPNAIRNIMLVIGGIALLLSTSFSLTFLLGCVLPITMVPVVIYRGRLSYYGKRLQERLEKVITLIDETFFDMRSVHMFARQDELSFTFEHRIGQAMYASLHRIRTRARLTAGVMFSVFFAVGLLVLFGRNEVVEGRLTFGDLMAFLFYASAVAVAIASLSEFYGDLQRAAGIFRRLFGFFDIAPPVKIRSISQNIPSDVQGKITFEDVTFAYPAQENHLVLNHLDLEIQAGERVALIGHSGEGKSTIFSLILRLFDPVQGEILLDGRPIHLFDLAAYRKLIAIVPHDPSLITGTLKDNILFGWDASEEDVIEAAQKAQIWRFITQLPEGLLTQVGPFSGLKVSHGQKQRIALARALVRQPKVLLLDEATSTLDPSSEFAIQRALKTLKHTCTILLNAHHLSSIQHTDRIVVIEKGKVKASGTHTSLIDSSEAYRTFVHMQSVLTSS